MKDATDLISAIGPTADQRQQVAATLFGTLIGQSVVLLGWIVSYIAAIALLSRFAAEDLKAFYASVGSTWFWLVMLAPIAFIAVFSLMPTMLRAIREKRLHPLSLKNTFGGQGYFRLHPFSAQDSKEFSRPDGTVEQATNWILNTPHSLLYLTGASGSGKSSLIAAGVAPRLEDAGWVVVHARLLGDPIDAVRRSLLDNSEIFSSEPDECTDLSMLLRQAGGERERHGAGPLLIVIDQFEEFLILHDPVKRQKFADIITDLGNTPIPGIKLLMVFRSDYREMLFKQRLPHFSLHQNAFELASFNRSEAEQFLRGGGRVLDDTGYDRLFKGLDRIEDTRGVYRPITLNMVGLVLKRMGRQVEGDPGRLIETYLRDCLTLGKSRDFAKAIIGAMITAEGTKEPRSAQSLATSLNIKEWQVRATLSELHDDGLVRPLESGDWEVSHDFIARVVGQLIGRLRPNWISQSAPVALSVAAIGWLAVVLLAVPLWLRLQEDKALEELAEINIFQADSEDGVGLRLNAPSGLDDEGLIGGVSLMGRIRNLASLDLSFAHSITDLSPLKGMPLTSLDLTRVDGITDLSPLKGMPLTSLDLSGVDGITDLSPLEGMPLTSLDLTRADGITDLSPLEGMPLTSLDLTRADGITDLSPLKGMPLTSLDLTGVDGITDLSPFEGMPLTSLDLSYSRGITDLSPLKGMPLTSLDLVYLNGITDLSPLKGMPLTSLDLSFARGITDLSPLKGMVVSVSGAGPKLLETRK